MTGDPQMTIIAVCAFITTASLTYIAGIACFFAARGLWRMLRR